MIQLYSANTKSELPAGEMNIMIQIWTKHELSEGKSKCSPCFLITYNSISSKNPQRDYLNTPMGCSRKYNGYLVCQIRVVLLSIENQLYDKRLHVLL